MSELLSIPPLARTVIYYVLGVATIVVVSADKIVAPGTPWLSAAATAIPLLSALFLGVAASNVSRATKVALPQDAIPVVPDPAPVVESVPVVPDAAGQVAA